MIKQIELTDYIAGIRCSTSQELSMKLPPWLDKFSFVRVNRVLFKKLKGTKISAHELYIEELQIVISDKQSKEQLQSLGTYLIGSEYLTDLELILYHNENAQETSAQLQEVLPALKNLKNLNIILGLGNCKNMESSWQLVDALRKQNSLESFHLSFFQEFSNEQLIKVIQALKPLKQLKELGLMFGWTQKDNINESIKEIGNTLIELPLLQRLSLVFECSNKENKVGYPYLMKNIGELTNLTSLTLAITDNFQPSYSQFIADLKNLNKLEKLFLKIRLGQISQSNAIENLFNKKNLKQLSLMFLNTLMSQTKTHFQNIVKSLKLLNFYEIQDSSFYFKKKSSILRNCPRLVVYKYSEQ